MTSKIFKSILLVAAVVLLASVLLIMGVLYDYFGGLQQSQLRDKLELAAISVEEDGTAYLSQVHAERYRLTWIGADGAVLYDTSADGSAMENHGQREEVLEALATGTGESTRYSATLLEKTTYLAQRLEDGTVLRISAAYATVGRLALGLLQPVLAVLLVALILSGVLANGLAKRIVQPLNNLDLEEPLENDTYPELAPLLGRIDRQHSEITRQVRRLKQKTDEFAQITANLTEGLVLLDEKGKILSLNPAAARIFGADQGAVGQDLLTLDRTPATSRAVETALAHGHGEVRRELDGREYQLDVSRIVSGGETLGAVILAFDITDRERAERTRREFTANVSHELKTPLQGIIGSAELIETGMVKPEDMPRFVGHIRQEAARLVTLIDDIIRLSQLDEGEQLPRTEVDLLSLAQEVETNLRAAAEKRGITLTVEGEGEKLQGVPRLLYEIVYNLCDNAIKYNVDGGSVHVTVEGDELCARVIVADTGIGIPAAQQDRVFERFYRVDKSHSKASGGTGLGLSIVKHAVQYHGGRIALESEPGKGTRITVTFPK